ncbi:uncharacterized protein LOC129597120 [Paramacrobiotus metropolitanus]|uniref:uncharacterized protein LOC129597120 n=1 Tax=Paramacrobiotus metropolitanus TaxID=2943436 RepID=UPI0024460DB7|nr:uncharacterized protein LOC129597120 [Paramacrobiotus metropolitanus]
MAKFTARQLLQNIFEENEREELLPYTESSTNLDVSDICDTDGMSNLFDGDLSSSLELDEGDSAEETPAMTQGPPAAVQPPSISQASDDVPAAQMIVSPLKILPTQGISSDRRDYLKKQISPHVLLDHRSEFLKRLG